MTAWLALPVIAIRVWYFLRRRGDKRMKWNLQITVNTSRPCMQGLGAASASLLAVEVVPYRISSGHSFEALCTVRRIKQQRHRCRSQGTFFPNECECDLQFLDYFGTYDLNVCSCYLRRFVILSERCNWYILVTFLDCGLHDMRAPLF
jgi:hypothetical protein